MTQRFLTALFLIPLCAAPLSAGEFTLKKDAKGISVFVDGKLFTKYLIKSGAKPILYPVIGPTGIPMTRSYPIEAARPDERKDHVHHRSFWFTHGNVNGVDFWSENKGHGNIIHRKFLQAKVTHHGAVISTVNDWIGPDGKRHCQDLRTYTFGANKSSRWVDADITITAIDGPCKFGDTKEGSFGVRLAGSMKVTSGGTIVNSHGQTNVAAWGKAAPWVDYYAKLGAKKEMLGVAIFNHPKSFRYPTYWHVRTYGLFTANPFGLHHFISKDKDGSHSMKKGESFRLRHRVLFHTGDAKSAKIAELYKAYAAPRPKKSAKASKKSASDTTIAAAKRRRGFVRRLIRKRRRK